MKRLIIYSVILLLPMALFAQESASIVGVWELVKGELKEQTRTTTYPTSEEARHMKIITESYFSTVWVDPTHKGDLYPGFNGGTYTYTNGILVESHSYFNNPRSIGSTSSYQVRVEGDRLFMSPVSKAGKAKKFGFFEEWKRIE